MNKKATALISASAFALAGALANTGTSTAQDRIVPNSGQSVNENLQLAQFRGPGFAARRGGPGFGPGRGGPGGPGRGGPNLVERFDSDGDGKVTQAEIDAGRASQLAEFDSNGDGNLRLEEFQAMWVERNRERMVDAFQRFDDDGDSVVTGGEFAERTSSIVTRLDRNNDGALSSDDRPQRGQAHRHGQDHKHVEGSRHGPGDTDK